VQAEEGRKAVGREGGRKGGREGGREGLEERKREGAGEKEGRGEGAYAEAAAVAGSCTRVSGLQKSRISPEKET
jgi:hypothetical protein